MLRRGLIPVIALIAALSLAALLRPSASSPALEAQGPGTIQLQQCKTFKETGKTLCDAFLVYWEQQGKSDRFGYPISSRLIEFAEDSGKLNYVQYFEKARFEIQLGNRSQHVLLVTDSNVALFQKKYPLGEGKAPFLHSLPHVADAYDLKVERYEPLDSSGVTVIYRTASKPDAILQFYDTLMLGNGWMSNEQGEEDPYVRDFVFDDHVPTHPVYTFDVLVSPVNESENTVQVRFFILGPG